MLIKTLVVGHLETNCYVVTDETTLECAIIDPGAESNTILDYIETNGLKPRAIFLTHGHFDHYMGLDAVREETGAPTYIHAKDVAGQSAIERAARLMPAFDGLKNYRDGDTIAIGSLSFTAFETPGHTPGGVSLITLDASHPDERALFTGDTLFRDSCGRTDSILGSMEQLVASLKRLSELPGDWEVYPGHAESSTLEHERRFNYYVRYALGEFPDAELED
ncbi:MAG: MBL fold metallo-hydrolase [Oscillospiraceae bacterium]|jgi:glyoxylase-like metal-dependent hydrolase (beta-lactamase superfamily II)|nr:MBL fold metallo-hydrolase [Oscillospiraceae bacterium]